MSLRDCLQEIYDRRGILTPSIVLEEARNPSHSLHSRFEWDDTKAAESWRREQAHTLIRTVQIIYRPASERDSAKTVRAWQAVRTDRGHEFKPSEEVSTDPFLRQMVLSEMAREWQSLKRRYDGFTEFAEMIREDLEKKAS